MVVGLFLLRDIALRLLPALVVVWATAAVLGGAVYTAKHAEPPSGDAAAKAGLGLCAVSVAMLARRAVRKLSLPPLLSRLAPLVVLPSPQELPLRVSAAGPPAKGPPILLLTQVSRI